MAFTRRRMLASTVAAAAGLAVPAIAEPWSRFFGRSRTTFTYAGLRYPLLLTGESITASEKIKSIDSFLPLFSPERAVVNPTMPRVEGRQVVFTEPGEYYLRINRYPVRVVVFPRGESISSAVLRLFHFLVANSLYSGLEDSAWYKYRGTLLDQFFTGTDPLMLSCGPTHAVFRVLVTERFHLPCRIVSLAATYYVNGNVAHAAHNVPEIYLPDVGKFVMFDINNGFVARWMDAFDLTEAVRAQWGATVQPDEDWKTLGLDLVREVDNHPSSGLVSQLSSKQTADRRSRFRPAMVSPSSSTTALTDALRTFFSGPGYWGRNIQYVQPTGTEFLPGDYHFASYHIDPFLEQTSIAWQETNGIKVTVDAPPILRRQLAEGACDQIASRAWERRFPTA